CQFAGLLIGQFGVPGCHAHRAPAVPAATTARPVVRGAQSGLEVWSWVVSDPHRQIPAPVGNPGDDPAKVPPRPITVRDDRSDVEAVLVPYLSRPVPVPEETRERWRASGMRLIAVPASDLERVLGASRQVGQVQRQWLGEATKWTDAALGPSLSEAVTV